MKLVTNTDRPYLFSLDRNDKESELLVENVLKKLGFVSVDNVCFLDSQMDFDCFKATVDEQILCFKYSFDIEGSFFAHEFNILKQLAPFSPVAKKHGKIKYGDPLQYIITSFEDVETVTEFGLSSVFENKNSFFYSFNQLQKVSVDRTFAHYIKDMFARCDIDTLPEHIISAIKSHSNLNMLRSIISILKKEIEYLLRNGFCKNSEFCHGNLGPENILIKNGLFKFQNLQNGYMGNRFFDLSYLFIKMGIPLSDQRQVVADHYSTDRSFNRDQFTEEYNFCFNLMIRLFVCETIFNYLCEVYLYENSRPEKILRIVSAFLRNEEVVTKIPSLNEYSTFLIRDIMEPVVGTPTNS